MPSEMLLFHDQPAVRLTLPQGDACTVALHGAQLLSWVTGDGVERLYLSPRAQFDGRSAIRGGVPVCWPQFNQRGALAKHGFARNLPWQVESGDDSSGDLVLVLHDGEATRQAWPHAFGLRLRVSLQPRGLRVALDVDNRDAAPWSFTAALHTYLRVDDIAQTRLEGLRGARRWDAVRDERQVEAADALRFDGSEFDSVYAAPAQPLRLVQPASTLRIAQGAGCTETVVWNPGATLAARLSDLPEDGWRHMLCVEAARIDQSVPLRPGERWQGWQQLTAL